MNHFIGFIGKSVKTVVCSQPQISVGIFSNFSYVILFKNIIKISPKKLTFSAL
ncbi:hypothetical protein D3C86_1115950 [compost metagenome]